jgi:hypothetical protein
MKRSLVFLILSVWVGFYSEAALDPRLEEDISILFKGSPGHREIISNPRHILCLDKRSKYGSIVTTAFLNPQVKELLETLVRTLDLMPEVYAVLSSSKGKGSKGKGRRTIADKIRPVVSPGSITRSISSASISPESSDESRAASPSRSMLGRVTDAVARAARALSPSRGSSRASSPAPSPAGTPLSSATDLFQTPPPPRHRDLDRVASGDGRSLFINTDGGSPGRASSVTRGRSFFRSSPGTPSSASDTESELKAQVTVLKAQMEDIQQGERGRKLSEEKAKVKALTAQLGSMMEEIAKIKADNAALEERMRTTTLIQADRDKKEAALTKRVEELVTLLDNAQKENIALTRRITSTQSSIQALNVTPSSEVIVKSKSWFSKP